MKKYLFHGSYEQFPAGAKLNGGREGYEEEWALLPYYQVLEKHRPDDALAHREAVFACEAVRDIEEAGGPIDEWLLLVEVSGGFTRHDVLHAYEISSLLRQGIPEDDPRIIDLARDYWSGEASAAPVWEYLAREMIVHDSAHHDFPEDIEALEALGERLNAEEDMPEP